MPIPDKDHRIIQKLIEQAQPQNMEEMQALLDSLMGKPLPDHLPGELSIEEQVLEMVYDAWEAPVKEGIAMAEKALRIFPDCIEAHEFLAAKMGKPQERLAQLEEAVEIGRRIFGGDFLNKNKGAFWGITETRPFMRCLTGLAGSYWEAGKLAEATAIWEETLELNPNDNQGNRYGLALVLLELGELVKFKKLRKKYQEGAAMMYFNDALAAFLEKGENDNSNMILRVAFGNNRFVPPMLLASAPPTGQPDSYAFHSREEAVIYARDAWRVWSKAAGARQWLDKRWALESAKETKTAKAKRPDFPLKFDYHTLGALVSEPFSAVSPLKLRPDLSAADIAEVPMFKMFRQFLHDLRAAQPLKLTPKGNLPRTMIRQLYDHRILTSKYVDDGKVKLLSEGDFLPIHLSHVLCDMAGLVKKRLGKLSLTKVGEQVIKDDVALYHKLLKAYCEKFNWSYMTYDEESVVQYGWATSLCQLLTFGDEERNAEDYARAYLANFPQMLTAFPDNKYFPPEQRYSSCFQGRFFSSFCGYFGLAEVRVEKDEKGISKNYFVKKSALADRVFEVDIGGY